MKDNGKGISPEVLQKLGKEGVSFGKEDLKESGTGIGLYHAIETVKKWGGNLYLESTEGVGTIVNIELPLASPPLWFLSSISIKEGDTIVVLDDDHEIHHTWDEKFRDYISSEKLSIVHLTTPEETRAFFSGKRLENLFFLSDYELIGYKETGHDLIKELNLSAISTLVTSHYAEDEIQEKCRKIGLKILPKMMAMNINVEIKENLNTSAFLEAIYIEDDKWLREAWDKEARRVNKNFISIECPEKFLEIQSEVSKVDTEVYIDQNYDNSSVKGIDFANILYQQGYKKLFLVTGVRPEEEVPLWLTVVGKSCPWETSS